MRVMGSPTYYPLIEAGNNWYDSKASCEFILDDTEELDYLFVDMPPGTGDVALTVFQSLPIDGIVIVSTPQDLVKMIVNKAYNMANMMNIPVLGLIENMSYYVCPNCNEKINIFGKSKIDETAAELGVPVLAKLPINPEINALVDEGRISEIEANELDDFVELLK